MHVQSRLLASEKALRQEDRASGSGKLAGGHEGDAASDMGGGPKNTCHMLAAHWLKEDAKQSMSSGMGSKYNPPTEVPQTFEDQNTISSRP